MRRSGGFTPVEIAVVVATVVLLVGMAVPTYESHIIRVHRGEARDFLVETAERQALYRARQGHYADELRSLGVVVPESLQQYYTIELDAARTPESAFTLTAIPRPGTVQAGDGELRLNSDGQTTGKW